MVPRKMGEVHIYDAALLLYYSQEEAAEEPTLRVALAVLEQRLSWVVLAVAMGGEAELRHTALLAVVAEGPEAMPAQVVLEVLEVTVWNMVLPATAAAAAVVLIAIKVLILSIKAALVVGVLA